MQITKLAIAAIAVLSVAACDKNNGLDDGPMDGVNGANAGMTGNSDNISASNLDPSSIAYFKETIGDRVLFAVDQVQLAPEGAATLDKQAGWLIANPNVSILIEGHADEQGTREYNLALGARRASSVSNYLASKGVPDSRLKTITYGKERPLEVCSTEVCYSKNRRAVTVVAGGLGS
ncbi:peptidoglycan-associated lipoprotein [Amylibacter ulvae]|uniref:Peptidoglycan-associated lipoprotein n=1 Tax=Paramylibacter ulvae TaxID=1651968 RepID=A0ABQ3D0D4_9RHOB|nr:peptidoglycan-associated lipoprotein Pal [Amylibacter ulvae]GHA50661.1 peptidoglycan-associated lipoprotein [Amylibacter ulvae]